jgi:hypothetical protein
VQKRPQEGVLDYILGVLEIPGDPKCETEDPVVASLVNLTKRSGWFGTESAGVDSVGI